MGNTNQQIVVEIFKDLESRYGSFTSPNYSFVQAQHELSPYKDILCELESFGVSVEDITDLNDDVCLAIVVQNETDCVLVQLSYVGRYACLQDCRRDQSIPIDRYSRSELESRIAKRLEQFSIRILSEQILGQRLQFSSPNSEENEVELYRVLFTDTTPPWRNTMLSNSTGS